MCHYGHHNITYHLLLSHSPCTSCMACYPGPPAAGYPAQAMAQGPVGSEKSSAGAGASGPPVTSNMKMTVNMATGQSQSAAPWLPHCCPGFPETNEQHSIQHLGSGSPKLGSCHLIKECQGCPLSSVSCPKYVFVLARNREEPVMFSSYQEQSMLILLG